MNNINILIIILNIIINLLTYCFKRITVECKRMSHIKKTYTLGGKIKQLIDLYGDSTNFDLSFTATCQDDTPFHVLVVDQKTLDSNPDLEYKETNKTISGNIIADKNKYQNYFLILKSDKKCLVDVELIKKELPLTPLVSVRENNVNNVNNVNNFNKVDPNTKLQKRVMTSPPSSGFNWKKIGLIALVVIIGICILWFLHKRKDKTTQLDNNSDLISDKLLNRSPTPILSPKINPSQNQNLSQNQNQNQDNRGFKPKYNYTSNNEVINNTRVSPDVMSQDSYKSSRRSDLGDNDLLHRLKKFAR